VVTLTWEQYARQVRAIAAGLARLGVGRGHTVALMFGDAKPEDPDTTAGGCCRWPSDRCQLSSIAG
jgi:acyl-CoA synthetase (AMP-forming)/AMP-acid ligase II